MKIETSDLQVFRNNSFQIITKIYGKRCGILFFYKKGFIFSDEIIPEHENAKGAIHSKFLRCKDEN